MKKYVVIDTNVLVPAPEWVGKSLREAAKNPPKIHYCRSKKNFSTIIYRR